ncbi:NusG domain II-containing protein [bacterium]|nr:NusG domain II-containing protein [bacterium]
MRRLSKMLRVGDVVIFLVLGASALSMIWAGSSRPCTTMDVEIIAAGECAYRAPLSKDFTFEAIGPLGPTTVVCQDGSVFVSESCCPNKTCVKMGKASTCGQIIVCVPNQIVVRIVGAGELDAVSM